MSISFRVIGALLVVVTACTEAMPAKSAPLSKSGALQVVVTIPVVGRPSSLKPIGGIQDLLDQVADLSAEDKKRVLDAVESGFVTAVRLESSAGGISSWLEVSHAGKVLSRGESQFNTEAPKLEIVRNPQRPNKAPEPTTTSVTSPAAQEPRQP